MKITLILESALIDVEAFKSDVKNLPWGEIRLYKEIDEAANKRKELLLNVIG